MTMYLVLSAFTSSAIVMFFVRYLRHTTTLGIATRSFHSGSSARKELVWIFL